MQTRLMAVILAVLSLMPVVAAAGAARQGLDRLVAADDGTLWVVRDGIRHRVEPALVDPAVLAAWPEGEPWGDQLSPARQEVPVERTVERLVVVTATPAPVPSVDPVMGWRRVGRWEGTGDLNTEPFTVQGAPFRLTYTVRDARGGAPYACITVRTLDAARVDGGCYRSSGTTYVYRGPGTYYLDVNSADIWTVTVEDRS